MIVKVKDYEMLQTALAELCLFLSSKDIPEDRIFDCKLVACELLGNVLKHTDGETGLKSCIQEGFIELKVLSDSFFALPERMECSDVFAESGRGLFLVSKLCSGQIFAEEDGIRVRIQIEDLQ